MKVVGLDAEPPPNMVAPGMAAIYIEATLDEAREVAKLLFGEDVKIVPVAEKAPDANPAPEVRP
jgi:hypothetical protein